MSRVKNGSDGKGSLNREQSLTCGLHDALKDDNNLKLFVHERALRQVEKGALGIDFVANGERGHQEELVCTRPKADIQFALVQRQELALGCLTRLKQREEKRQKKKRIRWVFIPKQRKEDS